MRRRIPLCALAILPLVARAALACPNCRESESADGFQWAILLMIGGVLTIGGSLVYFLSRVVRQLDDPPAP